MTKITEYLEIESYSELDKALTALDNDKLAAVIVMPEIHAISTCCPTF